jgi:hypothetical protein
VLHYGGSGQWINAALTASNLPPISLTSGVTGILPPANGGTGINNGSNTLTVPTSGTAALLAVANTFTANQTINNPTSSGTVKILQNAVGIATGGGAVALRVGNSDTAGRTYVALGEVLTDVPVFLQRYGSTHGTVANRNMFEIQNTAGDVRIIAGGTERFRALATGGGALSGSWLLTDTSAPAPSAGGSALYSESGVLKWRAPGGTIYPLDGSIPRTLDSLSDVVITSPATKQVVRFDGTTWVNAAAAWADLPALTQGSVPFAASGGDLTEDNAGFFWDATAKALGIGAHPPAGYRLSVEGATPVVRIAGSAATDAPTLRLIANGAVGGSGGNQVLDFFDSPTSSSGQIINTTALGYFGFAGGTDRNGNRVPVRFLVRNAGGSSTTGLVIGADTDAGRVGIGNHPLPAVLLATLHSYTAGGNNNDTIDAVIHERYLSGPSTTGFSLRVLHKIRGGGSGFPSYEAADQTTTWAVFPQATRRARTIFNAWDFNGPHEGMRIEGSGGAAGTPGLIGFLGAPAVARQTLAAAATDAATTQALANTLRTALINFGLGA